MAPITRNAPSRRALLPIEDELEEENALGRRRPRLVPLPAVTPELHAANARFADAILGTSDYDDAARTALSDLSQRGEAAAPALRDLFNQLHGRDPEAAAAFAGSVRRLAEERPSAPSSERRPAPAAPVSDLRHAVGHYLLPGQVRTKDENLWAEAVADFIPIMGNIRSASYAARDFEDAMAALSEGDYLASAGHGAMALFDALGTVPGAGNLLAAGRPFIRNAVRATPGLRRAHASWTLASAARQFDKPISVSPENLYGGFWSKLSPRQRKRLEGLQPHITGKGSEGYNDELLTSSGFHHQGDGKIWWGNPKGEPRKFDAETAERFDTIFFGLFAVPDKRSGSRMLYELKTAGGKLDHLQKAADRIISQSETIRYLRLHLDQVPFEFLAAQTRRFLQNSGSSFAAGEVEELVKSMRRARTPEGKPLTTLDWLMGVARIGAEAARSESVDSN